jgi:hypothetical protein
MILDIYFYVNDVNTEGRFKGQPSLDLEIFSYTRNNYKSVSEDLEEVSKMKKINKMELL